MLEDKNFYVILLFDVLLIIGFIVSYYIPSLRKLSEKSNKFENKSVKKLKRDMNVDVGVYILSHQNAGTNAFQIGARGKYVFITRPFVEKLNSEETLAVIAHEFAHIKLKHVWKTLVTFYLILGLGINAAFLLPVSLYTRVTIFIFLLPFAFFVNMLLKKRFNYDADLYAIKFVDAKNLISALKKINGEIHPIKDGKIHPFIKKRIEAIENGERI